MIIIWINVNHKENWTVVEKREITNVFKVENVFS